LRYFEHFYILIVMTATDMTDIANNENETDFAVVPVDKVEDCSVIVSDEEVVPLPGGDTWCCWICPKYAAFTTTPPCPLSSTS